MFGLDDFDVRLSDILKCVNIGIVEICVLVTLSFVRKLLLFAAFKNLALVNDITVFYVDRPNRIQGRAHSW